jgi:hypothetical protein
LPAGIVDPVSRCPRVESGLFGVPDLVTIAKCLRRQIGEARRSRK